MVLNSKLDKIKEFVRSNIEAFEGLAEEKIGMTLGCSYNYILTKSKDRNSPVNGPYKEKQIKVVDILGRTMLEFSFEARLLSYTNVDVTIGYIPYEIRKKMVADFKWFIQKKNEERRQKLVEQRDQENDLFEF